MHILGISTTKRCKFLDEYYILIVDYLFIELIHKVVNARNLLLGIKLVICLNAHACAM